PCCDLCVDSFSSGKEESGVAKCLNSKLAMQEMSQPIPGLIQAGGIELCYLLQTPAPALPIVFGSFERFRERIENWVPIGIHRCPLRISTTTATTKPKETSALLRLWIVRQCRQIGQLLHLPCVPRILSQLVGKNAVEFGFLRAIDTVGHLLTGGLQPDQPLGTVSFRNVDKGPASPLAP